METTEQTPDTLDGKTIREARYEHDRESRHRLVIHFTDDTTVVFYASIEQGAGAVFGPYPLTNPQEVPV